MYWKAKVGLYVLFVALLSLAMCEVISGAYHTNWLASAIWFLAAMVVVGACAIYKDTSLAYFTGESGTFQARFSKQARVRFLGRAVGVATALAIVGLLVQAFS